MKTAKEKAELTAEFVRDGLTAHMVSGTMDKRAFFLRKMRENRNLENLRVLRSSAVIAQYGKGHDVEQAYDGIDELVLASGEPILKRINRNGTAHLRVTIPYTASALSTPNCLECHHGNEGDVLGAISMEIDVSDVMHESTWMIMRIVAISLVILLIAILVANYFIKPYVKLFDDLEDGISRAYHGDFTYRIDTNLGNEAGEVAERLNELSDIYRFKKTIEQDVNKESIYERLIYELQARAEVDSLIFLELDTLRKRATYRYSTEPTPILNNSQSFGACRALRIGDEVISSDFPELCSGCSQASGEYICLPYAIDERFSLLIHMRANSTDHISAIKRHMPMIMNYLDTAHPVIESKILLQILKDSSYKDGLTGLYNRRYLNHLIDEGTFCEAHARAVTMIDVDLFKSVNDTYGHDIGDQVIRGVAEILTQHVNGESLVFRFGGEEFMVIWVGATFDEVIDHVEGIRKAFSEVEFKAEGAVFSKTLSAGIARIDDACGSIWESVKTADKALYWAKNSGRNCVEVVS